jgi:hypothetical protein
MVYTVDLLGDANLRVRDLTITRNTYLANVVVDASADLNSVTTVGNTTTNSIEITSAQASTSKLTGALKVSGGVGVQGNVHVGSNLFVESNLEVGTANLFVDTQTGNVGIGTTNPQGLLHISSGTSGDAHLILEADTDNNNETDNPKIVFKQDGGYYIGEIGLTNNQMAFRNKTGSGGGFIFYSNVGAGSTTDINELEDTQVEVMRITGDGNVGIGSNNPKTPLEVRQPNGYFASMYIQKYLGSGPEQATSYVLLLKSESSNPKRFSGKISGVRGYSSSNNTFEAEIIAGVGSAAVLSGRMTFTYSGNSNNFYAKLVSLTYNSSTYIALALIPTANYNGMSGGIYFNGKTSAIDELQYITDLNTLSSIVDFPVSDGDKTTFTGNVGIGTTDPNRPLTIDSTSFTGLSVNRTGAGGGSAMEFINGDGDKWTLGIGGTGTFAIYNGATFGEQITMDTSGNVGIGQTNNIEQRLYIRSGHNYTSDTSSNIVSNSTLRIQPGYSSTMSLFMGKSDGAAIYQQVSQYSGATYYNLSLQPYGGHVGMGIKDGDKIGSTSFSGNYDSYASILHMQGGQVWYGDLSDNETWRTVIASNDYRFEISLNNAAFAAVAEIQYNTGSYSDLITFTGQHRCAHIRDVHPSVAENNEGLIVCANRDMYESVNGERRRGISAITVNESVPLLSLSNVAYDKTCFGVISSSEDPDERKQKFGNFVSNQYKETGDTFIFVNSVGEGGIWVVNTNGALDSGDFITTSNVAGYGQRQESEFLANYSVAKITMRCDFNPPDVPKQRIVRAVGDVNYWINKKYFNTTEEEYSNLAPNRRTTELVNEYFSSTESHISEEEYNALDVEEKETYDVRVKTVYKRIEVQEESKTEKEGYELEVRQELVNVLDEHGQLQWEDDPSGATEKAYKIRYLDASGQQTDEANAVHIAAFVGCTYHCG